MRQTVVVVVILSGLAQYPSAQTPRDPSNATTSPITIAGRVVEDQSGQPIRNARVALSPVPRIGPAVTLTDGEGRFVFSVPPWTYTIAASKTGYTLSRTRGAETTAAELRLRRGAVIAGRAVDEFGEPVIAGRVTAELWMGRNSTRAGETETDDRGEYRLSGLPAGRITVAIQTTETVTTLYVNGNSVVNGGRREWKTFYPGVLSSDEAQSLQLDSGEERPGIDFILPADHAAGLGSPRIMVVRSANEAAGSNDTSVVSGRVTTVSGRPLSHVRVDLTRVPRSTAGAPPLLGNIGRNTFSDEDGRFELRDLPAGRARLTVTKPAYSPVSADGTPLDPADAAQLVDLKAGDTRDHVDFTLAHWGAVAGRVFDEYGDPVKGANVQLLQPRYQSGGRRLMGARAGLTDDLGGYRVYGLPPGQYVVSATVGDVIIGGSSADLPGYGRSYFPGTPNADEALVVQVGLSQETFPIDFALSRIRTALVSGVAFNAAGEQSAGGSLTLRPSRRSSSLAGVDMGARVLSGDRFEFPNIPPGDYVIQLYKGRPKPWMEGEFGVLRVPVNGDDVTNLVLQTMPGSTISGRFAFESADRFKRPPRSLEFSPVAVDSDTSPSQVVVAEVDAGWRFEMMGVTGLRRLTLVRPPEGWALKEIRVNGIDATDQPMTFGSRDQSLSDVEVVLTDRVNEIVASMADDKGRPAAGAHLIVFSGDRDKWYPASRFMRKAVAGADGLASIKGLPDGVYHAAAVSRVPADGEEAWQDPEYLTSLLRRVTTVTRQAGQKIPLRLTTKTVD